MGLGEYVTQGSGNIDCGKLFYSSIVHFPPLFCTHPLTVVAMSYKAAIVFFFFVPHCDAKNVLFAVVFPFFFFQSLREVVGRSGGLPLKF